MTPLIQHLRRTVLLSGTADLSDMELLECYLDKGEEAAIAALVKKHARMVWGVCWRQLGNHHDAEDAFQATFLVLARKVSSISPRDKLANWLYGVACKTARKAKMNRARRLTREKQVTQMPDIDNARDDSLHDLVPVLDQELGRLPKKFRLALILCELEGKTRKQAARELGLPEGTVAGHLARGRTLLASRLSRYGLAIGCVDVTKVLATTTASAAVPQALLSVTAKSTMLSAAGKAGATALISKKVALLAQGVIKTMLLAKLKTGAGVVLISAILCGGIGTLTHQTWAGLQTVEAEHALVQDDKAVQTAAKPPAPAAQPSPANRAMQVDHNSPVLAVAWSPDGKLLITGAKDGSVLITDVDTGKALRTIATGEPVAALAISPDSKLLAISSTENKTVGFWETETGNPLWQIPVRFGGDFPPASFAFGADGQSVVSMQVGSYSVMRFNVGGVMAGAIKAGGQGGGGGVVIGGAGAGAGAKVNAIMPKAVVRPGGPLKGVSAMAADGSAGGSCDVDGRLFVWDSKTNKHSEIMQIGQARCLAFIPGRTQVAVAGDDNSVVLWDWAEKKKVATLTGLTQPAAILVCSKDGSTLAALADDKTTTVVWNLASNKVRSQTNHRMGDVQALALSPDGTLAATAFVDNKTVYVSNAAKRELTHKGMPLALSPKELTTLWADMASQDFSVAEAAWQKIGAAGNNSVGFLREQIRTQAMPDVDLKEIRQKLAALDSPNFAAREKAVKELVDAGEVAVLPLQRLLEKSPSTEAATRAEMALKKLPKVQNTPERRRVLDAIELLEQMQSSQAVDLLREIERDALIAQIQREARQALQRIAAGRAKDN